MPGRACVAPYGRSSQTRSGIRIHSPLITASKITLPELELELNLSCSRRAGAGAVSACAVCDAICMADTVGPTAA